MYVNVVMSARRTLSKFYEGHEGGRAGQGVPAEVTTVSD